MKKISPVNVSKHNLKCENSFNDSQRRRMALYCTKKLCINMINNIKTMISIV